MLAITRQLNPCRRPRWSVLVALALALPFLAGCSSIGDILGGDGNDSGGNGNSNVTTVQVQPTLETQAVASGGDADDIAIWLHPTNVGSSLIVATAKDGGLGVYNLQGQQVQWFTPGRMNNVDVFYGFTLGGQQVDLVGATDRDEITMEFWRVDASAGQLVQDVVEAPFRVGVGDAYGIAFYWSPTSGIPYVFVTGKDGKCEQYELFDDNGRLGFTLRREFDVGDISEGIVVDQELGDLYIAEEDKGLWKYGAEPVDGNTRTAVDSVGSGGRLDDDVEGICLYYAGDGTGYLIASSQGASRFDVYRREGDNAYVGSFTLASNSDADIDAVSETDGIDVTNRALPGFPNGFFIAQDGQNSGGSANNFKLVPWPSIAQALGGLTVDTSYNPRSPTAR